MQRLILIRHSLPEIVSGMSPNKWDLSDEGIRRARLLADAVAELQPSALYSSAEAKSTSTAEAIAARTGLSVGIDPYFNEQHRSNEPFVSEAEFNSAVKRALTQPTELVYGEETVEDAVTRFSVGVENAIEFAPPGDVAIVSHGTVISGFVVSVLDTPAVPLWQELGMPGFLVINWPEPDGIQLKFNVD